MAIRVMAHALLAGGDTATGRGDMPDRPARTGKAAMIHVPGQPISIAGASLRILRLAARARVK
ncbi:hypothetical protein PTKU64_45200 [Paraburkholderia terrae]|uniref:Uncharacterized protein n=1 Tax=Paraburkholderia terrae TaxID=311230 RepID=A0ABN6JIX4_9BURK|nr:hypothetical protein PTKU64_45200 [Paraburkholderia terrae]BDC40687.1 hypothetical protein PTKU15_39840 [Paraburkholderia terrae]